MSGRNKFFIFLFFILIIIIYFIYNINIKNNNSIDLNESEKEQIKQLSLAQLSDSLPLIAPERAILPIKQAQHFGKILFFSKLLSQNNTISCASCHKPNQYFTDGLRQAHGLNKGTRHTPTLIGAGWQIWQMWDGRADSLWMQTGLPLFNPDEMGLTPALLDKITQKNWQISGDQARFALASYVQTLGPKPTDFDLFAQSFEEKYLNKSAQNGLKLFLNRAQCIRCHNTPLFTDGLFHNTALGTNPYQKNQLFDRGRLDGLSQIQANPERCGGEKNPQNYNKNNKNNLCLHWVYFKALDTNALGAFKTPTLRNIKHTAPYMHDGRFDDLDQVLNHYNIAPVVNKHGGHSGIFPLQLTPEELQDLKHFLETL